MIEYLNKLNRLLLEFLDLRAGYVEATRSYDEEQIGLSQARAAESRDDAMEAMEALRAQAKMVNSMAAGMAAVSEKIEGLGEFPNPLAAQGRARKLHDEAMKMVAPVMFEGEWSKPDGDRMFLKVIEDLGGGKYLELSWILVAQFYLLEISKDTMTATLVTPPRELNTDGQSSTETLSLANKNPQKISYPKQLGWSDVLTVAQEMRPGKLQQFARWRAKNPNAQMGLAGAGLDPEVRKKMYEEDLVALKGRLAERRQSSVDMIDSSYQLEQWTSREPIDKEAYRKAKTAAIDQCMKQQEAEEVARLRQKYFGEKPPGQVAATPAASSSAAQAAAAEKKRLEAESAQLAERRKLINADIEAFKTRIAQMRSQIAGTPDEKGKEQLNWSMMVLERNLQDKRDELATLETGEWTRTRTTFDEYCFSREAEKNRDAAETWGKVSRMLSRMERQIAQAPADQRDRLREFWQRQVTPETIAKHDFARMKQAAIAASNTARVINSVFEGYTQAVLKNLADYAADPQAVKLDETGAGLNGALWEVGKEAVFQAGMKFVVQPAMARFTGGGQPPARPRLTAQQMIEQSRFRMRQLRGREAVERFVDKSKALAEAGKSGASRQAIQQLRQEADTAYRAIKADYFAKNYLKNLGRNNSKAVHSYNSFDRANMNQYQQRIRTEAKRQGLSEQEMLLFSNSASKGGVGMDIDLGLREPQKFIMQGGKLVPNPAYTQWSRGLTQTLPDGTVVRLTPGEFQRKMQSVMETSFTDHFGRAPDEAFLRFTYSGDPEAYKKLAWIGGKGLKTANFAALSEGGPSYARQAGDVSLFKVTELPVKHPSLGTYGVMQEQCRGMVKDITTKLAGSPRGQPIAPNSPLAKAPKAVQDHYMKLRDTMDDFATNRIGPVEAERRINMLTGGRGMVEVAEQFGVTLQGGVNQMGAR